MIKKDLHFRGIRKAEVIIVTVLEGDGSPEKPFYQNDYYILNEKDQPLKILGMKDWCPDSEVDFLVSE